MDSNFKSRSLALRNAESIAFVESRRKKTSVRATSWIRYTGTERDSGGFCRGPHVRTVQATTRETARPLSSSSSVVASHVSDSHAIATTTSTHIRRRARAAGVRGSTAGRDERLCKSASGALPLPLHDMTWWWLGTGPYAGRRRTAVDSWPSWVLPYGVGRVARARASGAPADGRLPRVLFTSKKFYKIWIVVFSFVFDKYCLIMD